MILRDQIPEEVKVEEVMEANTITLSQRDPIKKALGLLTVRKFSLPVVENRKLIGLVSFMDVLKSYLDARSIHST